MRETARTKWRRRVAEWMASGETCGEFCRGRGLKPSTLGWWKWKLTTEGELWEAPATSVDSAEGLEFVEITSLVTHSARRRFESDRLELCVDELRVRVPEDFDARTLSRLLDVLEARR